MTETLLSSAAIPKEQAEQTLLQSAETGPEQFRASLRQLEQTAPRESIRACLRYLAEHGENDLARAQILPWLVTRKYFEVLLDPNFLPVEKARKAAECICAADSQFFLLFSRLNAESAAKADRAILRRALVLAEGLNDASALLPWLRALTGCADERVRSQAVKVTCKIRTNPALISRHLHSGDDRMRANAVEALWGIQTREAKAILREALNDPHHRVILNALVGLHLQFDPAALRKILEYLMHPSEDYRAASIWAIGYLAEVNAIPALKALLEKDASVRVRVKAERVLAALNAKAAATVSAQAV